MLPPDTQKLDGNPQSVFMQLPKGIQEYPTSMPRQAIANGKHYTYCAACGGWVEGAPITKGANLQAPKITHKAEATILKCPRCKNTLATVGTSLYNTGVGQNITKSSNQGQIPPRR